MKPTYKRLLAIVAIAASLLIDPSLASMLITPSDCSHTEKSPEQANTQGFSDLSKGTAFRWTLFGKMEDF